MINSTAAQQLALDAARQGFVLLENNNSRLPLTASNVGSIALIGPNADATTTMQGNYQGKAPFLISPSQGLKTYVSQVSLNLGCANVACSSNSGFDTAVDAAKAADEVIVVVGLDQTQESEGHDRTSLDLPGYQNTLVQLVAQAAKNPIIVVVMTGGAVDLTTVRSTANIGAILWCGYPGQAGGQAMADVIFGAYNPGGRLPYTIFPANFINIAPMFNRYMRPNATSGYPGRTYRFYVGEVVYPYGTGLSYTTFSYSNNTAKPLAVSLASVQQYIADIEGKHRYLREGAPTADYISITVTNTGKVAGSDVVQVRWR